MLMMELVNNHRDRTGVLWEISLVSEKKMLQGESGTAQVARHPNRPTFLDIVLNISDKFVELHGDRAGLDDPAIVCGIASIDGVSFMVMGHQKGRNTKVSQGALSSSCVCFLP